MNELQTIFKDVHAISQAKARKLSQGAQDKALAKVAKIVDKLTIEEIKQERKNLLIGSAVVLASGTALIFVGIHHHLKKKKLQEAMEIALMSELENEVDEAKGTKQD
jgi:hypothetical protein